MENLKHIVIISDGIRGHYHQSLGVSKWLERLSKAKIEEEILIPKLTGIKRFIKLKIMSRRLIKNKNNYAKKWLENIKTDYEENTLFISTGSGAAAYNLALAKVTGNKSAVIMTPSVLGVKPFDYAIVPEHDKHEKSEKIFETLGAPNHIYIPELRAKSQESFELDKNKKNVAILIGGNDANYEITSEWAERLLKPLKNMNDINLFITTSRRTGRETDEKIKKIFVDSKNVKYILIASEKPDENPIPLFLGIASHVLVTEDSVSMVSEAVTAGFKVGLLRVGRKGGFLKNIFGYGTVRFDKLFAKMRERKLLEDLGCESMNIEKFLSKQEQKHNQDFNEAKRAAEFILSK